MHEFHLEHFDVEVDGDFHVIGGEPQVVHAAHRQGSFAVHGGGAISCSGLGGAPIINCLRYCDDEAALHKYFLVSSIKLAR